MMRDLLEQRKYKYSDPTIYKYMKELGLRSITRRRKPDYKKGKANKVFPNLLNQNFKADGKNKVWCTDFTYVYLANGVVRYNCTIIDLFNHCPYDNAPMERYYNTLKSERMYHFSYKTKEELDVAVDDFAYIWYYHVRPHSYNNGKTPTQARVA